MAYSEWDNTPWSGDAPAAKTSPPTLVVNRSKAVTGPGVASLVNLPSLDLFTQDPVRRMAAYLRAYTSGWFYKAESKISRDVAGLKVQLMPQGADGDNEQAIVPPDLDIPFEALNPADQFLRLMERPNPFQTGRQLRQKTQIRRDMAGAAFWWLQGGDFGLPFGIYGISPSRMWPELSRDGRQVGWRLDKDRADGGVLFTMDEIVAFLNAGPYDDYHPVGVVESVFAELPLSERLATHTADVLATGGRLAGMLWPKARALNEGEFQDAIRAWRSVKSSPNAARELLLFPEPMEYSQGAASPKDIGIPELSALTRDNILTAFPISPYMLGVPMAGGLNESGASRREEKATYWEETIHPRVEDFEEDVQVQLLARYEAVVGETYDFEVQEPNLDDAQSLLEKAGAFRSMVSIGFDPEAALKELKLDNIKWNGLPALLDPAKQLEMQEAAATAPKVDPAAGARVVVRDSDTRDSTATQQTLVGKSVRTRDDIMGEVLGGFGATMRRFLAEQRDRVADRISAGLPKTKAARLAYKADDWWDKDAEDAALQDALREPYGQLTRNAMQVVADSLDRVVLPGRMDSVLRASLQAAGQRISGINETTRQAVAAQLEEGVRRGYSIPQIVDGVPGEGYLGVRNAPLASGQPAFTEYRAELIARTETMNAYNDAAIRGYGQFGVREVQAIDGDKDAECEQRDGRTYTIDDALGVTDHPNGTLDWVPVL